MGLGAMIISARGYFMESMLMLIAAAVMGVNTQLSLILNQKE